MKTKSGKKLLRKEKLERTLAAVHNGWRVGGGKLGYREKPSKN